MSIGSTCQVAIYIEGSAREGTSESIYDPTNIMGGARYRLCGREASTKSSGYWLCEEHAARYKDFKKRLDKESM